MELQMSLFHVTENNEVTQGSIQKKLGCPVKFWHYVPKNLEECPYIIIMARYTHNHPPPPLSKIPTAIQNDLKNIIAEENILDLTARRLITLMYFLINLRVFLKKISIHNKN
ncbi:hypothetical protein C2G38_2051361 [Gigaspora rosea]|uniref:Uncharacterized protein n=1 Tax=Gigaspora rosea TaxID=44941 RepID=A0A397TTR5_9GLOM|nr:hypothetical protein C2G38_2051361 [Gigaspora rosea]